MGAKQRQIMMEVDGLEVAVPRTRTRKTKVGGSAVNRDKFAEEKVFNAMPFTPIGDAQKLGAYYLQEGRKIVALQGPAGGGKSILAAWHAANLLREKSIHKLFLVRPYESCGRTIGAVPGSETEKLAVIFTSILEHLSKFLGKAQLAYMLEKKVVEFKSVEWLRGYSFEDGVFVLCEEAQGFDTDLMQMMTTRVGDGAQLCLTGDWRQKDIRKETGLSYLSQLLESIKENPPKFLDKEDIYELENNIGFVNFTFEDSGRRSKLTKALVKAFYFEKERN
ncbi:PhoH family protein [Robertmurraya sp.]|uniref:PhoH family protein n=1 Tax=Robertmurraya sp. TaxID=2837525 RepID=UPI003703C5B8